MKKLKKTLSGITALCIIAGTISATAVSGVVDFKATDIKSLSELLLNIKKADKSQTEMYDINNDSTLNVVDMIRLKSDILEKSATAISYDIQKLNNYAKIIFENAELVANRYISNGIKLNHSFTNNSDDDFIVSLTECIGNDIPVEIKYSVVMSEGKVSGILCTDNGSRCGAYPNNIPQNMNIPYNDDTNSYKYEASHLFFDWTKLTEYKSTDTAQANLPDYPELQVNELNLWASEMFKTAEQTIEEFTNAKRNVMPFYEFALTGDKKFDSFIEINDKDEILYSFEETLLRKIDYIPKNTSYMILIEENKVASVICTDNTFKSGAYPNSIPDNMEIEYSRDTLIEASLLDFKW